MQDRIWRTKAGQLIVVAAMTTSHISNCIRLIQRSIAAGRPWRVEYLDRLILEIEIRNMRDRS